ncbi:MAG: T9SS type A sorting domain-containing protein [Flavobacteriales bacterium]|nr:T9SS type A sorting domain-containing protein [Flavobacteriales bacterium]
MKKFLSLSIVGFVLFFSTLAKANELTNFQAEALSIQSCFFAEGNSFEPMMMAVPATNFSASQTTICEGQTVSFTDVSAGSPTAWSWVFNGGTPAFSNQQNPVVTYENAGNYPVILIASNNDGADTLVIANFIAVHTFPEVDFALTQNGLCGDSAILAFTNLDTNFTLEIKNNAGNVISTDTLTTIKTSGNYTYEVTNTFGCTTDSSFFITVNDIEITETLGQLACGNDTNGSITLALAGGQGPLTVAWTDTNLTGTSLINLPEGNYTVTVTDTNNCQKTETYTIVGANPTPSFNPTISNNNVCADSATLLLSNLDSVYTVSITNEAGVQVSSDSIFHFHTSGTFSYEVTDTSGCKVDSTFSIIVNDIEITQADLTHNNCSNTENGIIDLTLAGGQGPLTIVWSDASLSGNTIDSLAEGQYIVTISDTIGCSITDTFMINTLNGVPGVDFNINQNGLCGDSAILSFANLDTTYNVSFFDSLDNVIGTDTIQIVKNSGMYHFEVTDTNGCITDSTFQIFVNDIEIVSDVKQITCFGGNDGAINISINGGQPPFTFTWADPALIGDTITGLDTGMYHLTVQDQNGCQRTDSFHLVHLNELPTADFTIQQNTLCEDSVLVFFTNVDLTTNITIRDTANNVVGGGLFSHLNQSGEYTYTLTDTNGCTFDSTFSVVMNDIQIMDSLVHNNCLNTATGEIHLSFEGGQGPLTVAWDEVPATTPTISGLAAGVYHVTVTDTNNCSRVDSFEILTNFGLPVVDFYILNDSSCADSVEVGFNNIDTSYTVEIFDQNGLPVGDTSQVFIHSSGNFNYVITDTNGCSIDSNFTVLMNDLQLNATTVNATCEGIPNGSVSVNPTGGSGDYIFSWADTTITSNSMTNLEPGNYIVTVTDTIQNCSLTDTIVLSADQVMSIQLYTDHGTCAGVNDGSAFLQILSGIAPFDINWSFTINPSDTLDGIVPAGNHSVTITSAVGCTKTIPFTILDGADIDIQITKDDVYCAGDSNGYIKAVASGGTAPYTYLWSNNLGTNSELHNLKAGSYTLEVRDSNNCVEYATVDIIEESVIDIQANITEEKCSYTNDGRIELTLSGGVGPYTVEWLDTNITGLVLDSIAGGVYNVKVTGSDGCKMFDAINVPITYPISASYIPSDTVLYLDWNSTVNFTNNTSGALSYSWSFGNGDFSTEVNPTYKYTDHGTYYVTLTAFHGPCEDVFTKKIIVRPNIGVKEQVLINFEVYPNPTKNIFTIDLAEDYPEVNMELYDILGKKILERKLTEKSNEIAIPSLESGTYIIRLMSADGKIQQKKLIVQ